MKNEWFSRQSALHEIALGAVLAVAPMIFYYKVFLRFSLYRYEYLHDAVWIAIILATGFGAIRISRPAIAIVRDGERAWWARLLCLLSVPLVWIYWWGFCVMSRFLLSGAP